MITRYGFSAISFSPNSIRVRFLPLLLFHVETAIPVNLSDGHLLPLENYFLPYRVRFLRVGVASRGFVRNVLLCLRGILLGFRLCLSLAFDARPYILGIFEPRYFGQSLRSGIYI